jgi:ABC-2 type transport system ATP-binding protein
MALPIEDYALIGDTHTAALVGRNGSIDWLCLPRFDAGACFAALLGDESHGRWLLTPAGDVRQVRRKYREDLHIPLNGRRGERPDPLHRERPVLGLRRCSSRSAVDSAMCRSSHGSGTRHVRPTLRVKGSVAPPDPLQTSRHSKGEAMARTPIIEAHGLTKRFGDVRALDGLDVVAQSGQVTALLGPNGAGKTTFISAVATLLRPDGGEIHVAGIDVCAEPKRVRRVIGLAGQYASVEEAMTGTENLRMVARLFGLSRRDARTAAAEVLERLGLADAGDRLVRTYSGGMRRRLDLGASLVGRPQLLLLDEPTTGLDPRGRIDLWEAIRGLVADGTDVLLTTQYLEEADQLARHVVIVDHGQVIAAGTPDELKDRAGTNVIEVRPRFGGDLPSVEEALSRIGCEAPHTDMDTQRVSARVEGGADELRDIVRTLDERNIEVDDVGLRRPTLDEVFLAVTGRTLEPTDPDSDPQNESADAA